MNSTKLETRPIYKYIKRFFFLVFWESLAAAIWLLLIPGESVNAVFLGYSLKRLALLIPILFLPAIFAIVLSFLRKNISLQEWIIDKKKSTTTARIMILVGFFITIIIWIFALSYFHIFRYSLDTGAYIRLLPIMISYFLVGLEMILFVPFCFFPIKKNLQLEKIDWKTTIFWISVLVFIAFVLLIELTGLGKTPERVSIISLGVPLIEGQIWFVFGALFITLIAVYAWSAVPMKKGKSIRKYQDIFIFFSLWLLALMLWMSLPLPDHNYFAPSVRAPNFEKYPFSDAEQYDYNSIYVYYGAIDDFVVSKPLYVSFLTVLHFLGDFDYSTTVFLQTIVLAFLPAVIYLIGKELHSRLGGITIALFVILREVNGIQASTMANVSNSKLLLSDVPATLVIAIMVLIIIRWFRSKEERLTNHVLILGGLTAMLNLMRIQTIVFIPFGILLVIIRYFKQPKKLLISCLIFLLTIGVLLFPIILRNHRITGVYWIDNPSSSSALYRFFLTGSDLEMSVQEVETEQDILDRNFSVIFASFSQNLGQMLLFIFDNFSRNLISTFLILPVRFGNQTPFLELLIVRNAFWAEVYSLPNFLNTIVLGLNILVISIGLSSIYRKLPKITGLILLVYFVYNLSSSIVRLSGWRFIQPVDWIILVFYAIGLIEIIKSILEKIFRKKIDETNNLLFWEPLNGISLIGIKRSGLLIAVFFAACAFIPIRETLFPILYPEFNNSSVCTEIGSVIEESEYNDLVEEINHICIDNRNKVLKGYGFYPRFFDVGEGYYDRPHDIFFGRQNYSRIVFRLAGQVNGKIFIKTKDSGIEFINGTQTYVITNTDDISEAQLVIVDGDTPTIILSEKLLDNYSYLMD